MDDTIVDDKIVDDKIVDDKQTEKNIDEIKINARVQGKLCLELDCVAFNLIKRDDSCESIIRHYRIHVGDYSHPYWQKYLCEIGENHKIMCKDGYKCQYLSCSKDGEKILIDILEHLWVYRHKRPRRKNKNGKISGKKIDEKISGKKINEKIDKKTNKKNTDSDEEKEEKKEEVPKQTKPQIQTQTESQEETKEETKEEEQVEVKVRRVKIKGTAYLMDPNNILYDPISQDEVGIYNAKTKVIEPLPQDDDEEEVEDEEEEEEEVEEEYD